MTKLHDLYEQQGQSPWLDNLRRDYLTEGKLQTLVDQGIRGVTSNPTIFAKAIEGVDDYDEQFAKLLADLESEIADMPDRVVWLPANSAGCAVRRELGAGRPLGGSPEG